MTLTALNGPTGRHDEHDDATITKDPQSFFVDVVVFVTSAKAVGAFFHARQSEFRGESVASGVSRNVEIRVPVKP